MSEMSEKREQLQALRERYSELVHKIFNTPFNTKEYHKLDKEADVMYQEILDLYRSFNKTSNINY